MERSSLESILDALNQAGVRYLVAGGLAVVAHGYVRFTADLDLFVDLEEANLRRALQAFAGQGYRPRVPVRMDDFADREARLRWHREKGMMVFSLVSERHPATEIDLFVEAPLDFERACDRAVHMEIARGVQAPILGLEDLLELKRQAGRPKDLEDIRNLRLVQGDPSHDEPSAEA